ncbi:MAG TPA: c-type cytochrome domain-containing protein [Rhizomicrobium sp.]|nr:c-type cytochrome domain-containing protein [Rhizomicrobium sp.]
MVGDSGISGRRSGHLSAFVYFSCVALLTLAGVGLAMLTRPAFGHDMLQWIGLESVPQAQATSFYARRVAPVFETHCTSCHGDKRQKSDLRLDSFAAVLRGGKHDAVIHPGDVKNSELLVRISLPALDDRAMPPSGKTPLTEDEKTVIKLWIAHGASGSLRDIPGAPKPVVEVEIPKLDPARTEKQRAPLAAQMLRLQKRFPGVITYEARDSADLEIDASLKGRSFGDADLQALSPLAARIVAANLSGTAVGDASAPVLAAMVRLKSLRLSGTKVSDATIHALDEAKTLRSVTVVDTSVTARALAPLRARGVAVYGGGDGP